MSFLSIAEKVLVIRALDAREEHLLARADRVRQGGMHDAADRHVFEAESARELRMRIAEECPRGPEGDAALENFIGPFKR